MLVSNSMWLWKWSRWSETALVFCAWVHQDYVHWRRTWTWANLGAGKGQGGLMCAVVHGIAKVRHDWVTEKWQQDYKSKTTAASAAKIDALVSFCHEPAKQGKYYFPEGLGGRNDHWPDPEVRRNQRICLDNKGRNAWLCQLCTSWVTGHKGMVCEIQLVVPNIHYALFPKARVPPR